MPEHDTFREVRVCGSIHLVMFGVILPNGEHPKYPCMRVLNKKPKLQVAEEIPRELREFLIQVRELILEGSEEATVESDDLIQCERAYGGLIEEGGSEYGFTYFPGGGVEHSWEMTLSVSQIHRITAGSIQSLDFWKCESESCSSRFASSCESCFDCDYMEIEPYLPAQSISEKMEWGKEFFRLNPKAEGFHLREVLQQNSKLSECWGDFSNDELSELR